MLITYLVNRPLVWIIPLLIQIVSYWKILKKMGKRPYLAVIPVAGEWEMSHELFRHMRTFWRPAIIAACLYATARWIGTDSEYGIIIELIAFTVYGLFLMRLYLRLSKQFGKGWLFWIGMILMPLIFLPVLAFGRSRYLGRPEFRPEKERSPGAQRLRKTAFVILSAAEFLVLITACFGIATIFHPARPIAKLMINDELKKMESVSDSNEIVSRKDTLGADYEKKVSEQRTRDYFFPDHSGDKKVVVMAYIIGSNLEDDRGSASVNISQMKDATKKGEGLDFVIEAGGSDRWFTNGIKDATVGRYLVSGGELSEAQMRDDSLCMSEPEELTDFIKWTKENYPADRYMLVLWDHGGGFASGFGVDDLNKRQGDQRTMSASEIINAIGDAGVKFDLIGFDACLMQNIEYAYALEPYADYYLASQETEPAYGWFYTAGFGKLAEDPTLATEEFGRMMVSSYDQLYRTMHDGEAQPENTLSLVDLTLVKPVYEQLTGLFDSAVAEIKYKPAVFADLSAARSKSYQFYDNEQVDLVNFLTGLKKADYRQEVASDEDMDRLTDAVRTCIVYRNRDSAEGINGLSVDFPYGDLYTYSSENEQLRAVKYSSEENFFNNFCSIMASQRMRQAEESGRFFDILSAGDFTGEDWYVKGFEDYDTTDLFVDIPVKKTGDGYLPELPEKTWDTILDVSTRVYMVTDDGLMYIGHEYIDAGESEGHPLVGMDDRWININGHLACYEAETPIETDDGTVYRGTVQARLNDSDDITIHIEWDPVKEDSEAGPEGHVTGYSFDDEEGSFFLKKGLEQFSTGDRIEFVFDWYSEDGKHKKTDTYGDAVTVVTDEHLTVRDGQFEPGTELEYYGVLTDVYQRELMTEAIREKVVEDKN